MKSLVENKKARLEYEFIETYEAGIALRGFEVKALRAGKASLVGSRVLVRAGEAYLVGATISPYQEGNTPKGYDPERTRRLLVSKKELQSLEGEESQRGLTLIPVMVYNKNRFLKLLFALGRKKKKHDKRATLKERDDRRGMERTLKNQ